MQFRNNKKSEAKVKLMVKSYFQRSILASELRMASKAWPSNRYFSVYFCTEQTKSHQTTSDIRNRNKHKFEWFCHLFCIAVPWNFSLVFPCQWHSWIDQVEFYITGRQHPMVLSLASHLLTYIWSPKHSNKFIWILFFKEILKLWNRLMFTGSPQSKLWCCAEK